MASNVVLTGLARDLAHRSQEGNSVRVGLIGAGEMGTDIVTRTAMMEGVDIVAISDIATPKAHDAVSIAYKNTGHSQEARSTGALNAIIANGRTAITENAD